MKKSLLSIACAALVASPAAASEVYGGLYAHGVDTPLTLGGSPEGGVDAHLGFRGNGLFRLFGREVQPHVFGSLNSRGDTNYAGAGLSLKFGDRVYLRPGVGLGIHDGSTRDFTDPGNDRIEFGSRILFVPEVGIGARLSDRLTVEASLVHLSHATLFSPQNPGIDNIGVRVNWRL